MQILKDLKILKQKSKDFSDSDAEFQAIVVLLEQALIDSERKGVGLSAVQIGILKKVAIIRTDKLKLDLWNTEILEASDLRTSYGESCLSISEDIYVDILRPHKIKVKNGDGSIYDLTDLEAVCCVHEIDHWQGILITDRII